MSRQIALGLGSLALIFVVAGVSLGVADIETVPTGSSCANLAPGEGRELFWAVLPTRILVVVWLVLTGARLARRTGSGAPVVASALLVPAVQFFIGTEALTAILLVPLWVVALIAVVVAVILAWRRRDPWEWVWVGWLVLVVTVLPIGLLTLTSSGEVSIC